MQLTSSAFINNGEIPEKYTRKGSNVNPPLTIKDAPPETQSFVLIFQDPDMVPKAHIHWLVFNIPATVTEIPENSVPEGAIEGVTSSKKRKYNGPCPKDFSDEHQCVFRLYALDRVLSLPAKSTTTQVIETITEHILATAELIGDVNGSQQPSVL